MLLPFYLQIKCSRMETLQVLGYVGAFAIGLVMGTTGSGGSAMAVPIFSYLFLMDTHSTTAHSLFVVGMSASAGVLLNLRKQRVDWQLAMHFSIPMILCVFVVRRFLLPSIPQELFRMSSPHLIITRDLAIMLLFGVLMIIAAILTLKEGKTKSPISPDAGRFHFSVPLFGIGIGFITGITGIGGGFLIVPVLVAFLGLPIKKAIATSLMIVALKSFTGFLGDMGSIEIDWMLLLSFTAISMTGMTIGIQSSQFIAEKSLKKGFGYMILGISVLVISKELFPLL